MIDNVARGFCRRVRCSLTKRVAGLLLFQQFDDGRFIVVASGLKSSVLVSMMCSASFAPAAPRATRAALNAAGSGFKRRRTVIVRAERALHRRKHRIRCKRRCRHRQVSKLERLMLQ